MDDTPESPPLPSRVAWWPGVVAGVAAFALIALVKLAAFHVRHWDSLLPWLIPEAFLYLGLALPGVILVLTGKRRLFWLPIALPTIPLLWMPWSATGYTAHYSFIRLPVYPSAFWQAIYEYIWNPQTHMPAGVPFWVRHPQIGVAATTLLVLVPAIVMALQRRKRPIKPVRLRWAAVPALGLCAFVAYHLIARHLDASYIALGWHVSDLVVLGFTFAAILGTKWPWWPFSLLGLLVIQSFWTVFWLVYTIWPAAQPEQHQLMSSDVSRIWHFLPLEFVALLVASAWRLIAYLFEAGWKWAVGVFAKSTTAEEPAAPTA